MALYEAIAEAYDSLFPVHPLAGGFFGGPREGGSRLAFDVGCATGSHTSLLSGLGWDAVGLDPSPAMIHAASRRLADAADGAGAGLEGGAARAGSLRFERGGMLDLGRIAAGRRAGLVACLGNTVPHLASLAELAAFFGGAAAVLDPGGTLVVQQLNYSKILAERPSALPPLLADGWSFSRSYRYRDDGRLDFVTSLRRQPGPGQGRADDSTADDLTTLSPFLPAELAGAAAAAGLSRSGTFGGWAREFFDPKASTVIIGVWRKP